MHDQITPLLMTRDEEANLARTLGQLAWARDVVVVDSFSKDRTPEIARSFPNVRLFYREIDTIAEQWNFGMAQAQTPWVLALDADHVLTDAFIRELATLEPAAAAYRARFIYAVRGKHLRASLYPPREVLLQKKHCRFWQDGHTQRVLVEGNVGQLRERIVHDDRKSFARFVERQRVYMRQEAVKLRTADPRTLNFASHLRRLIVVAPFAVLVHTLLVKRVILDGWPGLIYAWERFVAELMLSRALLTRGGSSDRPSPADPSSS
jgi:glycosyltransferase involved in cell wall biosynthesis